MTKAGRVSPAPEDDVEQLLLEKVKELEATYVQWQNDPKQSVTVDSPAVEFFRSKLGYVKSTPPEGAKKKSVKHELPETQEYADAVAQIVETIELELQEFPVMKERMLDMVKQEFEPEETVHTPPTKEDDLSPYGEDWSMADGAARGRKERPVR